MTAPISRRRFLATSGGGVTAALITPPRRHLIERQAPIAGGRLVRTLPLGDPARDAPPLNQLLGTGLDARLFTDLSGLEPASMVTSNEQFFIRTARPAAADAINPWTITLAAGDRERTVGIAAL